MPVQVFDKDGGRDGQAGHLGFCYVVLGVRT